MSQQVVEADLLGRIPVRARQEALQRVFAPARRRGFSTDRNLLRKVAFANGRVKRAFDVVVAIAALIVFAPAFLTIAWLIKRGDNGPIFYRHTRVGRRGRRFECIKFRTMKVNAEELLARLLESDPEAAAEWAAKQKLRNDPRVTRIGAFLRKSSLDELPQFLNVLRGEMSVIGPRPITRAELNRYGRDRRYYLFVRPGITGLWQVSGRSSTCYESRVRYDREYLSEWSWLQEFWILLMTVPAVLNSKNAC